MVEWKGIEVFERFKNLSKMIPNVADSIVVRFVDNGSFVSANKLGIAFKAKGIKDIKPVDSHVFIVESAGERYEIWLKATNYTNLGELKIIAEKENYSLVGVVVRITRVALRDVNIASFKFEQVKVQ